MDLKLYTRKDGFYLATFTKGLYVSSEDIDIPEETLNHGLLYRTVSVSPKQIKSPNVLKFFGMTKNSNYLLIVRKGDREELRCWVDDKSQAMNKLEKLGIKDVEFVLGGSKYGDWSYSLH